MSQETIEKNQVMTVADLKQVLANFSDEIDDNFEVWLSSDEEGNEFLPMLKNTEFCLAVEKDAKRIILFPSHR